MSEIKAAMDRKEERGYDAIERDLANPLRQLRRRAYTFTVPKVVDPLLVDAFSEWGGERAALWMHGERHEDAGPNLASHRAHITDDEYARRRTPPLTSDPPLLPFSLRTHESLSTLPHRQHGPRLLLTTGDGGVPPTIGAADPETQRTDVREPAAHLTPPPPPNAVKVFDSIEFVLGMIVGALLTTMLSHC